MSWIEVPPHVGPRVDLLVPFYVESGTGVSGSPCNFRGFFYGARPYVEPRDLEHEEEARMAGDAAEEEARQEGHAPALWPPGSDGSQGHDDRVEVVGAVG